jgi:hypothetical protein
VSIPHGDNEQMRLSGAEMAVAHMLLDYGNDLGSLTPSALKVSQSLGSPLNGLGSRPAPQQNNHHSSRRNHSNYNPPTPPAPPPGKSLLRQRDTK